VSKAPKGLNKAGYFTVPQTSSEWGVSDSYVYAAIRDGLLKARVKRGTIRGYLITRDAAEEFFSNAFISLEEARNEREMEEARQS